MKEHRLPYGTLTVGLVRSMGRGSYRRRDTYRSDSGLTETRNIFAAGPDDDTPPAEQYDASCHCCWLGFPHTQAYHALYVPPTQSAAELAEKAETTDETTL